MYITHIDCGGAEVFGVAEFRERGVRCVRQLREALEGCTFRFKEVFGLRFSSIGRCEV